MGNLLGMGVGLVEAVMLLYCSISKLVMGDPFSGLVLAVMAIISNKISDEFNKMWLEGTCDEN